MQGDIFSKEKNGFLVDSEAIKYQKITCLVTQQLFLLKKDNNFRISSFLVWLV